MTPIPIVMSDKQIKQERIRNAAPQLLEALKEAASHLEACNIGSGKHKALQQARAAIRAAEGEE